MIAKINNGSSLFGAIAYNQEKVDEQTAKVIFSQNTIQNLSENDELNMHLAMKSFEPYLIANKKTEKPIVHISLNPDPKDTLSDEQFAQLAQDYMQKMGFENQPYLVFKHEDIDRHHIHIVTIRVKEDGTKISDSFEHRRSMDVCRELEQQYGLHPAEKKQYSEIPSLKKVDYSKGNIKRQLSNTIKELARSYQFQSLNEFRALLTQYNITVEEVKGEIKGKPYHGLVYSALNNQGEKVGNPFKSSLFGKMVGYEALEKRFAKAKENWENNPGKTRFKKIISNALQQSNNQEKFQKLLRKYNMEAIFRQNETGRIYGATFIDHQNKTVFNGSRLGKDFSANIFEAHFNQKETKQPDPKQFPEKEQPIFEQYGNRQDYESSSGGLFDLLDNNRHIPEEKFKAYKKRKKKRKHI